MTLRNSWGAGCSVQIKLHQFLSVSSHLTQPVHISCLPVLSHLIVTSNSLSESNIISCNIKWHSRVDSAWFRPIILIIIHLSWSSYTSNTTFNTRWQTWHSVVIIPTVLPNLVSLSIFFITKLSERPLQMHTVLHLRVRTS